MNQVNYFYEDTNFILEGAEKYTQWIIQSIKNEKYSLNTINYIFCSDEHLLNINKTYLDHDYYTDIITFNNSEKDQELESDIFISIDRISENAMLNHIDFLIELQRVMIHGILHLVGFDDKTEEQKQEMRKKENAYLSLLEN